MKKQLLKFKFTIIGLCLLSTMLIGVSCSLENENSTPAVISMDASSIPKVLIDAKIDGVKIPNGTTTEVINDGNTVLFHYPKGIRYIEIGENNKLDDSGGGSYTCTGSCDKGCDVFYVQGNFACSACDPNTKPCTGKSSKMLSSKGGFIDYNAGISIITTKDQLKNGLDTPYFLFKIPSVLKAMKEFNLEVYGVEDPTKLKPLSETEYTEVVLNLFGAIVKYNMPNKYLSKHTKNMKLGDELVTGADITCKCESGTKGCTYDSGFGYKKCTSGECDSCKMTVN